MNRLPWIYRIGERLIKKEGALKHFTLLIRLVFKSPLFKTIVTIITPLIMSLELKLSDLNLYKWYQWEFYYNIWYIILTVILYIIIVLVINSVDRYVQSIKNDVKFYREELDNVTAINKNIWESLRNINVRLNKRNYVPTKGDFEYISLNYQNVSILVCEAIFELIKNATCQENHQVSLLYKFRGNKKGNPYIKMIAYANKTRTDPGSSDEKFDMCIETNKTHKMHYHLKIFMENKPRVRILNGNEEILKNFIIESDEDDRVSKIEQYIGIPIFCDNEVISLLQIDTDCRNLFGKTIEEIEEFAENFQPFLHILLIGYYNKMVIDEFCDKLKLICSKISQDNGKVGSSFEKNTAGV